MAQSRPIRVLVVDYHPDSAEALAQLLAVYGYDTRGVQSCAEARAAVGAQAFEPDVVMLDLRLPDGDGLTLAGELCQLLPVRPVLIAHTGVTGMEAQCRAAGFVEYLVKPADTNTLLAVLTQHAKPGNPPAGNSP